MTARWGALGAALDDRAGTRARDLLTGVTRGPDQDDALRLLADRAREGSGLAAELLLEQLDPVVRRMTAAALLDAGAVDDVSQEALISIASSLPSYRGDSAVTTWAHAIVRRRVVDHLRRQRATSPLPDDDLAPSQRMSSVIATRATVRAAIAGLPEIYREPVTLRDLDGLEYAEIARRLGRSPGTVKAQISRGRALVAAALQEGDHR